MPPKAQRALDWSKDFNNASPTKRIEFLKRVEQLKEHERPKLNITSAKKLFEYMINVSACSLSARVVPRVPAAWRCARGAAQDQREQHRGHR